MSEMQSLFDLATDAEREAAESFYHVVHDFARELGILGQISTRRAAAVIAVLSPRSSWKGNKLDAMAICAGADVSSYGAGFNALSRDLARAAAIADGERVSRVLSGPKVTAFWKNICYPDMDVGIPVDRHIGRAALGHGLTDAELTKALARAGAYSGVERLVEQEAWKRGVRPIVFANYLWYVVRRLRRDRFCHSLPWRGLHEPVGIEPLNLSDQES